MFDGLLVTLLKTHINDGVKDYAAPVDDVEEDAQAWLFEASVKLQFTKYKKPKIDVTIIIPTALARSVGM